MEQRPLSPQQVREIASLAIMPEQTVRRAYAAPDRAKPSTIERITRVTSQLGLKAPGRAP